VAALFPISADFVCMCSSIFCLASPIKSLTSEVSSESWEVTASLTVSLIDVSSNSSARRAIDCMAVAAVFVIPGKQEICSRHDENEA